MFNLHVVGRDKWVEGKEGGRRRGKEGERVGGRVGEDGRRSEVGEGKGRRL